MGAAPTTAATCPTPETSLDWRERVREFAELLRDPQRAPLRIAADVHAKAPDRVSALVCGLLQGLTPRHVRGEDDENARAFRAAFFAGSRAFIACELAHAFDERTATGACS
jgi:hypothetical protein